MVVYDYIRGGKSEVKFKTLTLPVDGGNGILLKPNNGTLEVRFEDDTNWKSVKLDSLYVSGTVGSGIRARDTNTNLNLYANGTGKIVLNNNTDVSSGNNYTYLNVLGDTMSGIYLRSDDNSIRGLLRHTTSTANYMQLMNYTNYPSYTCQLVLYDTGSVVVYSGNQHPIGLYASGSYIDLRGSGDVGNIRVLDTDTDFATNSGLKLYAQGYYDTDSAVTFGSIIFGKENSTQGDQKGHLILATNSGTGLNDRITIDSSGNVDIDDGELSFDGKTCITNARIGYFYHGTTVERGSSTALYVSNTNSSGYALSFYKLGGSNKAYFGQYDDDTVIHNYHSAKRIMINDNGQFTTTCETLNLGYSGDVHVKTAGTNADLYLEPNGTGQVYMQSDFTLYEGDTTTLEIESDTTSQIDFKNYGGSVRSRLIDVKDSYTELINYSNNNYLQLSDNGTVSIRATNSNHMTLYTDKYLSVTGYNGSDGYGILRLIDNYTDYATGRGGRIDFIGYTDVGAWAPFATIKGVKANSTQGNKYGKLILQTYNGSSTQDHLILSYDGGALFRYGQISLGGSTPFIKPYSTNINLTLYGSGTGLVVFGSDAVNDEANDKWIIARSSGSTSGQGGLKFDQGSTYEFASYSTGTGSSSGGLHIDYRLKSDKSLQNGTVTYSGIYGLYINPASLAPTVYYQINGSTKGQVRYNSSHMMVYNNTSSNYISVHDNGNAYAYTPKIYVGKTGNATIQAYGTGSQNLQLQGATSGYVEILDDLLIDSNTEERLLKIRSDTDNNDVGGLVLDQGSTTTWYRSRLIHQGAGNATGELNVIHEKTDDGSYGTGNFNTYGYNLLNLYTHSSASGNLGFAIYENADTTASLVGKFVYNTSNDELIIKSDKTNTPLILLSNGTGCVEARNTFCINTTTLDPKIQIKKSDTQYAELNYDTSNNIFNIKTVAANASLKLTSTGTGNIELVGGSKIQLTPNDAAHTVNVGTTSNTSSNITVDCSSTGNSYVKVLRNGNVIGGMQNVGSTCLRLYTTLNTTNYIDLLTGSSGYVQTNVAYYCAGNKVVEGRKTGWTAATGTATRSGFATSTVTLQTLAEHVKALIDDLISHGLIGS